MTLAAGGASAATLFDSGTINVGDNVLASENLLQGETITYTFTAGANDVRILDLITINAEGFSEGTDIGNLLFGFDGNVTESFVAGEFDPNGATASASTSRSGFVLASGNSFSFTFDNDTTGSGAVGTGLTFSVAAVPLPAGALLLLSALGAGAVASRRKTKSA